MPKLSENEHEHLKSSEKNDINDIIVPKNDSLNDLEKTEVSKLTPGIRESFKFPKIKIGRQLINDTKPTSKQIKKKNEYKHKFNVV